MKPSVALASHREAIRRVVASHRARNPRVFGSVIPGGDTEGSDLDILIDPTPETTLFDIGAIRHELLQLLGVPVDVFTPKALRPNSVKACWQRRCRYDPRPATAGREHSKLLLAGGRRRFQLRERFLMV